MSTETEVGTAVAIRRESALAAIPQRGFNPLGGTLQEKILACDQIAANVAQLALNGWDNVPKCKAAFWLADAAGDHPATFMQNNYCMLIKGKIVVEPRWEYVHAKLKAGLPGFVFKVVHKGEDYCELYFADGDGNEHTEKYTMAYATKQGLAAKDTYTNNPTDMLFKQCYKRGADVIGAHIIAGLPPLVRDDDDGPTQQGPLLPPASAEVAIDKALETEAARTAPKPVPAPPATNGAEKRAAKDKAPLKVLSDRLVLFYRKKMQASEALEKASILYNQMQKEKTGVDPRMSFKRADEIGPADAQQMVEYLDLHEQRLKEREVGRQAGATEEAQAGADTEAAQGRKDSTPAAREPGDDDLDEAPEPEAFGADPDEAPEPDEPLPASIGGWAAFMRTVDRARKLFPPRVFVGERPKGSGVLWYLDEETYKPLGYQSAPKLEKEGQHPGDARAQELYIIDVQALDRLAKALETYCDAAERGRR